MSFEQPPIPQKKEKEEVMRVAFETEDGKKFFAETLTSPEDPRVEKVQQMLAKRFGKKEVDPVEVMKEAMTGKMETGEKVPRYLVTVIENDKGEVVAMASGAAVELVNKLHSVSKKEAVLLDAYVVISPALQKRGVDKHLFEARERAALQDAESRGLKLVGYIVEDGGKDEEMYNRYGAKRVYHDEGSGGNGRTNFREVRYFQPPVDWNKKTGEPAKGAGVVPEHLMVKVFPQEAVVRKETLAAMVRGMFLYNNEREEQYFANANAHRKHLHSLRKIEKDFITDLSAVSHHPLAMTDLVVLIEKELRIGSSAAFREHKSEEDLEKERK